MHKESNIIKRATKYVNTLLVPLENHYYHSYDHAIEVMTRAMYLAEKEWLSDEDIEMMWLAWLFHDTWFVIQYDKNEPFGAKIATNYLKTILYPSDRINKIYDIILATDPDYKIAKNIYEEIIKDADMDNLWREDFEHRTNDLKKELEIIKHIKDHNKNWNHWVIQILKEYKFDTKTQKKERNTKKSENLQKMIADLDNEDL